MNKFSMKAVALATVLGGIALGAVSASAALNLPTQSCSYMFNTNMRLGSRGVDVTNLQKVLNAYPQTRVAETGAGSPGMETAYFGPATRTAVNKFQALHLVELGITAPTGNVFAGTRGLLNMVCTGGTTPVPPTPGTPGTSGPVSVMLSPMQPTGLLVQSQAGAKLADLTFSGNGTVTSVELQRIGISSDSTLNNVYLYDGNVRITDAASVVTGGYIRFNASSGLFAVNGTRTISVRADIAASTSGQSVGVKLNSLTVMGGSPVTFTNVMGNQLQIGSATVATANFSALDTSSVSVDAGTTGYNVWSGTVSVGTRDINFKAATFKFVGSAPVDALANISLYVDGSKVAGPSMINAANNNKISFDLGSAPYLLKTGSHSIDVRGDVVKGSNRTMTFSVENVADLFLEDTSLTGVNVSPTVASSALTQGNSTYRTITVNKGSVTVNVDPTFVANKVTGGATNVPVGQFTMKGYGEDVKVNTLRVTFATTTISTLNNVSLYVNGGQVGTSQNFTVSAAAAGGLTYTLGSSLIIPAGQTITFTVKADIVDTSNAAYTSGTVAAVLGGVSLNAQGQNSNELVSVAGTPVTGNSLTISSGVGTFARTAGFTAVSVPPNSTGVKVGSFTLQANSSENVKVTSIGVNLNAVGSTTPAAVNNYSNLTVKDGSTIIGTPVGNPSTGTSTFSISGDLIVPANGTKTFDVYVDIGGNATSSVTAAMDVNYRGSVSNTTTISSAAGIQITSASALLAASTLSASSPVTQYVVGGTTYNVATFTLKTSVSGTTANVRELRFSSSGTDAVQSITVNGVTAPTVSGTTTVTGLSIPVSSVGTDVPVFVKFSQFQNNAKGEPGSLQASIANSTTTLTYVEGTSGSGSVITEGTAVASNAMKLVASKPIVTVGAGNTDSLVIGSENKVGEFTVSADANGKVSIGTTSLDLAAVGVTGVQFTSGRIADGNTTIPNTTVSGSSTMLVTFTNRYEIPAGTSKTFSLYANVAGTPQSSITPYVTSRLTSAATFVWYDVIGGNSSQTGTAIYNFPTTSFTTKR